MKLNYKKSSNSHPTDEKKKKASKRKHTKFFNGTFRKLINKAEDIARDNDDLDTTDLMTEDSYMIPVIFHNLKGYDSHLIMQYITREYAPSSIDVIPTSSEKFFSFQIGNRRVLYSLQFLTASLDTLEQSLATDGTDKFNHTAWHCPDSDLVFAKGNYPYEYMDERDKFLLIELPPIDAFYSSLSEETITPEEYDRGQKVWREFGIENM